MWDLHDVIIKKSVPLARAKDIAKKIIANPGRHYFRETGDSYRFRNLPKTRFLEYKSKVVNPEITLIFGRLKN